ncbi:hypothetical protein GF312_04765 [Candidatus Poribacteria bacterium]|nr:hypothetical protein [Candidatus Poribacteria bacterium]
MSNKKHIEDKTDEKISNLKRIEYQKKIEAELKQMDVKIHKLEADTAKASSDVLMETKKQIRKIREKREELEESLKKLKNSGDEAWMDIKEGIDNSLAEMKAAFTNAMARFI